MASRIVVGVVLQLWVILELSVPYASEAFDLRNNVEVPVVIFDRCS